MTNAFFHRYPDEIGDCILATDPATGKTMADIEAAQRLEDAIKEPIESPPPWVRAQQSPAEGVESAVHLQKLVEESGKRIDESVGNLPEVPEPSWLRIARQTSPETLAMMQHALRMQPALVASPMGLARLFPGLRK